MVQLSMTSSTDNQNQSNVRTDLSGAVISENTTQHTGSGPEIGSIKDLHSYGEAITMKDGKPQVKYTFACFIDKDDFAYFGGTQVSKFDLTPQVLKECLKRVPDEDIYPKKLANVMTVSSPLTEKHYLKRPDLKSWDDFKGSDFLPRLFSGEVEAHEFLYRHPHLNIVQYYGCTVNRGRITGIVLDSYPTTLKDRLDRVGDFGRDECFQGIESAVNHLHSLGWAHNDLNSGNIMLDTRDRPVLIDFGSCKPYGKRLMEAGTKEWVEDTHSFVSEKKHDDFALQKIRTWMEEKSKS